MTPKRKNATFLSLQELLLTFKETPWMEPETRAQASVRALTMLSKLPSWEWAKLHYQTITWYDKSRKLLESSQELLYYPEVESVPMTVSDMFLKENPESDVSRIVELVLQDYTVTQKRIRQIMASEGRMLRGDNTSRYMKVIRGVLGALHHNGVINLNQMYKKEVV